MIIIETHASSFDRCVLCQFIRLYSLRLYRVNVFLYFPTYLSKYDHNVQIERITGIYLYIISYSFDSIIPFCLFFSFTKYLASHIRIPRMCS